MKQTLVGLVAATLIASACGAASDAAIVTVTDATIVRASATSCTPIVLARIGSNADTELTGASLTDDPKVPVSLHVAAGGPRLGGHDGHLDGNGKRPTAEADTLLIKGGSTVELSAAESYLALDAPKNDQMGNTARLTFHFSNAADATVVATVINNGC